MGQVQGLCASRRIGGLLTSPPLAITPVNNEFFNKIGEVPPVPRPPPNDRFRVRAIPDGLRNRDG